MICRRCLLRLTARRNAAPSSSRSLTQSAQPSAQMVTANTTTATNPRPHDSPAATSTSAAQPFSAGSIPALEPAAALKSPSSGKKDKVKSSVPAGTVLKGLNFLKNAVDPVARDDAEYPDWLWRALERTSDVGSGKGGGGGEPLEGDLFAKSKKQRRQAAKALRKREKFELLHPELAEEKVPVYEQSVDLPAGDGSARGAREAAGKRRELTRSMRVQRRKKIKEDNFLKTM